MVARIDDALREAQQALGHATDDPRIARLDAEILLAHVLDCSRTHLRTWPEREVAADAHARFQQLVARRAAGEPVAYLTGSREFWDMTLRVTPDTLIPRPETERLVELALERIPADAQWRIADLGTGSGAIALALARERPRAHVVATDVSPSALEVARDNAARLKVTNIEFRLGRWCEPLAGERFQLIASNPPYVHPADPHLAQGDLRFEPPTALASSPDGLADIRIIIEGARAYLHPGGWLLLEHGYDQGRAVEALLRAEGYHAVEVVTDLGRRERVGIGRWEH
jgi:release factor glutamine methyltransferase